MKKVLILFILSTLLISLASAQDFCKDQCKSQKNLEYENILIEKKSISSCRADIVECMQSGKPSRICHENFKICQELGKEKIKEHYILANENYHKCVNTCEIGLSPLTARETFFSMLKEKVSLYFRTSTLSFE